MDSVKRKLRDGVLDGELAPAILVLDTVHTVSGPVVLKHLVRSVCDNVVGDRAQAKGVVLVSLNHGPESYAGLPYAALNGSGSFHRFQLVDCYSDPLGWEVGNQVQGFKDGTQSESYSRVVRNVRDLGALFSMIIESGRGTVNFLLKERFSVFLDSVSVLLRYHSLLAVITFLEDIRSHDQVAALSWLVHADLHEPRMVSAFEYLASVILVVEAAPAALQSGPQVESKSFVEEVVRTRQKRRNGRVREQVEKLIYTPTDVSFKGLEGNESSSVIENEKRDRPMVQFNLALSEVELQDRANVILPFEHQGSGQEEKIYDGRLNIQASYLVSKVKGLKLEDTGYSPVDGKGSGEIHYLRDSEDEFPDSDEDPDDDLDI